MKVVRMAVGYLSTNCYIAYDDLKKEGIVIDPGGNGENIIAKIKELGISLKYIIFTHVHFDHILAYHDVKVAYPCAKLLVSHQETDSLSDDRKSLVSMAGVEFERITGYEEIKEGDFIEFGDDFLKVIETPGHTEGSVCLYGEKILFSGDTLFLNSVGRWDFPGGSMKKEVMSIINILFKLPADTVVYPGHGDKTTIGYEIENNEVSGWI